MGNERKITFFAQEEPDGGYIAWAEGHNIFTQADSWDELLEMIKDAVKCHFEDEDLPLFVHVHFIKDVTIKV